LFMVTSLNTRDRQRKTEIWEGPGPTWAHYVLLVDKLYKCPILHQYYFATYYILLLFLLHPDPVMSKL
jgi:hypothetical protein